MTFFMLIMCVILVLGVLRIDGMMKEHLKNDRQIIERLDIIINMQDEEKD